MRKGGTATKCLRVDTWKYEKIIINVIFRSAWLSRGDLVISISRHRGVDTPSFRSLGLAGATQTSFRPVGTAVTATAESS